MAIARLATFLRDRRGAGAVEFAVVAPVLLLLYVSGSELAMAVSLNRKVQHAGATVNDLITQSASVSKAEVDRIFAISASILAPYSATPLRLRATSIKIVKAGKAQVECSRAYDKTASPIAAYAKGVDYPLPADFAALPVDTTLMVVQTQYDYVPLGGYGMKGVLAEVTGDNSGLIRMGDTSYLNPRIGNAVSCSDWNS